MKQFIAYIFLFIFSFQVLPVKELGKLLCKGQMTEEVHEYDGGGDGLCKAKKGPEPLPFQNDHSFSAEKAEYINAQVNTAMHLAELLPVPFVPEIPTPPPNC